MSEKIKRSDISESDLFGDVKRSIESADSALGKFYTDLKATAEALKQALQHGAGKSSQSIKDVEKSIVAASKAEKEYIRLLQEQEKLEKLRVQTQKAEIDLLRKQEAEQRRVNRATQDASNAYKILQARTREAKNESKRLGAELLQLRLNGQKNTFEYIKLENQYRKVTREASRLDKQLKKLSTNVGDDFVNVGKYERSWSRLKNVFFQFTAGFGVVRLFREAFTVVRNFDQELANLASVLGKTRDQIQALELDARRLGATTKFTASEVAKLQTEFAKFGFTETEILNATEATLSFAAATGTELPRSAEIAAATLRGFALDASEMQRVVDVMAKSFSSSALDTEKFAESMKYVAPIAKAAGLTIEETTALLGKLADAGISGSMAGTSLRQIISQLDKTGKSTGQALQDLSEKGLNLAGAEEEVGRNAKTALLVLADQTKEIDSLTESLNKAEGSAKAMAETQLDTLGGSLALLRSAFEGYILDLNESTTAGNKFAAFIRLLAQNFAAVVGWLGKLVGYFLLYKSLQISVRIGQTLLNKELRASIFSFNSLTNSVKDASGNVSKFGNILNNIGWSVIIGLATELVMQFWDIASGADSARRALDRYNKSLELGREFGSDTVAQIQKTLRERELELRLMLSKKEITKKAFDEEIELANKRAEARIKAEIKLANEEKARAKANKDNARVAMENETLKQLYQLQRDLINQRKEDEITKNNQAKASDDLNKKHKEEELSLKKLTDLYKILFGARQDEREEIKLSEVESKTMSAEDIEAAEEAIKNRRRNIAEIKVLNAELYGSEKDLREARIEQIKEELAIELENIELSQTEREKLTLQAEKDIAAIEREGLQERLRQQKEFFDLAQEYFVKQSEARIEQIDREIEAAQNQLATFQELAKNGNIQATQSIKEQQILLDEANRRRIEEEKRLQRIKQATVLLEVYQSKVEAGDKTPLISTIRDVQVLREFINTLPSFKDGIDVTDGKGQNIDGKNGFLSILHPKEQVRTAEQNRRTNYMPAEDLTRIGEMYNSGMLVEKSTFDGAAQIASAWDMKLMLSEMKGIKKAIENQPEPFHYMESLNSTVAKVATGYRKGNLTKQKINMIRS